VKYILNRNSAGTWRAAILLPEGDGTFASVASGLSKGEAMAKAAAKPGVIARSPAKAKAASLLATAAANPLIRDAIRHGGIEAAKMAATALPGGGAVVKALELAQKYKPAARLLKKLLPW